MGITIAIAARKRHGKDLLASYILAERPDYNHLSFANLLKQQCTEIFGPGIPAACFWDDDKKDKPFNDDVALDRFVPAMREITGLDIQEHGLLAGSGRDIMKAYGTEYVRSIQDDYWITNLPKTKFGVITDLRFVNEASWLRKKRKARIIKVVRGAMLGKQADTHSSESELDQIWSDLLLVSHNDNKALHQRVGKLLGMGYWKMAQEYDYNIATGLLGDLLANPGKGLVFAAATAGISVAAALFLRDYYASGTRPAIEDVAPYAFS